MCARKDAEPHSCDPDLRKKNPDPAARDRSERRLRVLIGVTFAGRLLPSPLLAHLFTERRAFDAQRRRQLEYRSPARLSETLLDLGDAKNVHSRPLDQRRLR
jgi:hypothetical protein